jgi:DNA-binding transcriptional LysR family regulator
MDQFACIKAFIAVVENRSVHMAAQSLHQTDAAISKKLTKLEASLNVILLTRTRGKFQLTDIGAQYYQICKQALSKIDHAEQLIQQVNMAPKGELKVTCNRWHVEHYLMPKLKAFVREYPGIELSVNIAERIPDFSRDDMDILFGVALNMPAPDNLVRRQLGSTRAILCASPAYLKKIGMPKKPKDLLKLDYICHHQRLPMDIISLDKGIEIAVKPFLKLDDTCTTLAAVLDDLGFMYTKAYMVEDLLRAGKLIEILPEHNKAVIPIYSYYRYQPYPDAKIRAFMDFFMPAK